MFSGDNLFKADQEIELRAYNWTIINSQNAEPWAQFMK